MKGRSLPPEVDLPGAQLPSCPGPEAMGFPFLVPLLRILDSSNSILRALIEHPSHARHVSKLFRSVEGRGSDKAPARKGAPGLEGPRDKHPREDPPEVKQPQGDQTGSSLRVGSAERSRDSAC